MYILCTWIDARTHARNLRGTSQICFLSDTQQPNFIRYILHEMNFLSAMCCVWTEISPVHENRIKKAVEIWHGTIMDNGSEAHTKVCCRWRSELEDDENEEDPDLLLINSNKRTSISRSHSDPLRPAGLSSDSGENPFADSTCWSRTWGNGIDCRGRLHGLRTVSGRMIGSSEASEEGGDVVGDVGSVLATQMLSFLYEPGPTVITWLDRSNVRISTIKLNKKQQK